MPVRGGVGGVVTKTEHVERHLAACLDCRYPHAGGLHDPIIFTDESDVIVYAERHALKGHRVIITTALLVQAPREVE